MLFYGIKTGIFRACRFIHVQLAVHLNHNGLNRSVFFKISSIPFANPGDPVRSVDNFLRMLKVPTVTTVTSEKHALLYSPEAGQSKLYDLAKDPAQERDIIADQPEVARELHQYLVKFMRDTRVAEYLLKPRLELCI
jgi:hypothetical protein